MVQAFFFFFTILSHIYLQERKFMWKCDFLTDSDWLNCYQHAILFSFFMPCLKWRCLHKCWTGVKPGKKKTTENIIIFNNILTGNMFYKIKMQKKQHWKLLQKALLQIWWKLLNFKIQFYGCWEWSIVVRMPIFRFIEDPCSVSPGCSSAKFWGTSFVYSYELYAVMVKVHQV